MCGNRSRNTENTQRAHVNNVEGIEEKIKVNNTVVDNELGGRDMTVLPSCKQMWDGLKKGHSRQAGG